MEQYLDEPGGLAPNERKNKRTYFYEYASALTLYVVLLIASVRAVEHVFGPLKFVVALTPAIGMAAMLAALVRFVMRTDELQRRNATDAAAVAAIGTVMICSVLGFLENTGISSSMTCVFPIAVLLWGITFCLFRRRYS